MNRHWRIPAAIIGGVLAFSALANVIEHVTPSPHGPRSSSYATSPEGLAAYAQLLSDYGHPIRRLRRPPSETTLDPRSTVVLLDPPSIDRADGRALRAFLQDGGRLVVGGEDSVFWLGRLLQSPPDWSSDTIRGARSVVAEPETTSVETVEAVGPGVWTESTGEAVPLVAGEGGSIVAVSSVGAGRAVLFANTSPLQNRLLDHADNAALGLGVVGSANRRVDFVESVHGYSPASGFGAVPWSWRVALGGLVLAALALMLARGRRLGPAEAEGRDLPPPRRVYVESLAAVLARTKRPEESIEAVRAEAQRRLAQRAELEAVSGDEPLRAVGRRAGLTDDELDAVLSTVRGKSGVLDAGRALAKLEAVPGRTS